MTTKIKILIFVLSAIVSLNSCKKDENIEPENAETKIIVSDLLFAEGPAYYEGNLYFSDIQANKIYKWNTTAGLQVFKETTGGANVLYFDNSGTLIVCEGTNKRITSIAKNLNLTILADKFDDKPFN